MIDWKANGDPYFFENHHPPPLPVENTRQPGGEEYWIFYNTTKFSGKKLTVRPGEKFKSRDNGVYTAFVWKGTGTVDGQTVRAGEEKRDELLVCHEKAVEEIVVENTGSEELVIFKFFGPDVNADLPMLQPYRGK